MDIIYELRSAIEEKIEQQMFRMERRELRDTIQAASSTSGSQPMITSTTSHPTQISEGDSFTEETVQEIVRLGFTREQVILELRRFNGDKTQAMAALFAKSLKF